VLIESHPLSSRKVDWQSRLRSYPIWRNYRPRFEQIRKGEHSTIGTIKHGIELLRDPSLNKSTAFTGTEKPELFRIRTKVEF
jgi:hypothetical protein